MLAADFAKEKNRVSITASGLWQLNGNEITLVDRSYVGPATVLVPNEDILVVSVDLPFATRRQREAAAPYAVESLIGQPLDQVHVALGMEVEDRRHLCGVVRRDVMGRWVALADQAGLGRCIMVPDALMVPRPPQGGWRLVLAGGRALIRSDDGAGFAIDSDALPMAWEAAGRPRLVATGDALPEALRSGVDEMSFELHPDSGPLMVLPPLDLRQGEFAAVRAGRASPARTLAWVLGLGLAAHLMILTLDTLALHRSANRAEAAVRQILAERAPGSETAADLSAAVDRIVPPASGKDGVVVAALGRASQALIGRGLVFRSITYAPGEPLQLAVIAPDDAALQRGVQSLEQTGLSSEMRLDPVSPDADQVQTGGLNAAIAIDLSGGIQ